MPKYKGQRLVNGIPILILGEKDRLQDLHLLDGLLAGGRQGAHCPPGYGCYTILIQAQDGSLLSLYLHKIGHSYNSIPDIKVVGAES
jgi:hypothetical protein